MPQPRLPYLCHKQTDWAPHEYIITHQVSLSYLPIICLSKSHFSK